MQLNAVVRCPGTQQRMFISQKGTALLRRLRAVVLSYVACGNVKGYIYFGKQFDFPEQLNILVDMNYVT